MARPTWHNPVHINHMRRPVVSSVMYFWPVKPRHEVAKQWFSGSLCCNPSLSQCSHLLTILLSFHHPHGGTWNVSQIPPLFLFPISSPGTPTYFLSCQGRNKDAIVYPVAFQSRASIHSLTTVPLIRDAASSASPLTNPSICSLLFRNSKGSKTIIHQKIHVKEKWGNFTQDIVQRYEGLWKNLALMLASPPTLTSHY